MDGRYYHASIDPNLVGTSMAKIWAVDVPKFHETLAYMDERFPAVYYLYEVEAIRVDRKVEGIYFRALDNSPAQEYLMFGEFRVIRRLDEKGVLMIDNGKWGPEWEIVTPTRER